MILSNFHAHTTYSDGSNTAEEMVKAALAMGLSAFGLSDHAYEPGGESYAMSVEATAAYKAEMSALKAKYAGQIELLCGVEQDINSPLPTDDYDYVIGAAHSITVGGKRYSVDWKERFLVADVNELFGGDFYAYAEAYYRTVGTVARVTKCDIVAHFDLVTKFNEGDKLFDTAHPRYRAAAIDTMREILKDCNVFEVNTGAMSGAGRTEPYPQPWLLRELRERGGAVILSSDSHSTDTICYKFAAMEELLREAGFSCRKMLTRDGFIDIKL